MYFQELSGVAQEGTEGHRRAQEGTEANRKKSWIKAKLLIKEGADRTTDPGGFGDVFHIYKGFNIDNSNKSMFWVCSPRPIDDDL